MYNFTVKTYMTQFVFNNFKWTKKIGKFYSDNLLHFKVCTKRKHQA